MKYFLIYLLLFFTSSCNDTTLKNHSETSRSVSNDTITKYTDTTYNGMGGVFKDIYLDDSLVSHNWYDSAGVLRYTTPIDLKKISKTKIRFLSGRNYFDITKIDTLEILNDNLPFNNRGVLMEGSQCFYISENLYKLKALKDITQTPKQLKLYIHIYDNLEDSTRHRPIIFESVFIPVK